MIKYRIIFKKNNAKHFVNAYSYGLAKYFKDTPQILQKYSTGAYGNQPDVDGSIFTRMSEICNRTIFTSRAETNGIIAAFNDYNQIYAPRIEAPTPPPTPAQSTADLFKPYLFKGTIIDNDTNKCVVGATVSYVDSVSQQVFKQTLTSATGSYEFNVLDRRPFGIKVEKNGFFTQNLTGEAASEGKIFADNSSSANSGSSNLGLTTGSSANGNGANGSANNGATTGAAATGSLAATDGAITGIGATGNHLSARYMRYIHSSRYKHSIYYKQHLQHERELAKQKAASDAAAKSGLLAGSPATGSSGSGNTTGGGSATRSFAGGSSSGFAPSGSNGDPSNASTNGPSSQALAKSGKITDGAFVSPAIHLQAYAVNKPIVINNILYDYGYATLRPESITVLDGLVKTMVDNPKIVVELSAHTDSVGSDAYNLKLSQDRAQSCVDYMIGKGINVTRISAVGYGRSRPIAPNSLPNGQDNPDGRQLNRRIEFVVKGNDKRMTDLTHK
jgi:outer membrane protein OmpA-like peptidoglycan-associated protein